MRRIIILTGLLLALSLTACGSNTYNVVTHDGSTYTADGAPEYHEDSDTYTFHDKKGAEFTIKKDDLKVIEETED